MTCTPGGVASLRVTIKTPQSPATLAFFLPRAVFGIYHDCNSKEMEASCSSEVISLIKSLTERFESLQKDVEILKARRSASESEVESYT